MKKNGDKEREILESLCARHPELPGDKIREAAELLYQTYQSGGKLLLCGNGGNASDAEHIVGELMKGFRLKRELKETEKARFRGIDGGEELAGRLQRAIPAISLNSQTSLLTAIGNDTSYEMIFAQQVYAYGRPEDCLIAMSTSGNSANVAAAVKTARALGMKTLGITGSRPCALSKLCSLCILLPAHETWQIQEYTLPVYHALCAMLEERMFGE
ncbi:MAG: SIS domain-containing protein [Ruminococcus flavefaciens]|nr:SIS domain-containing protein [Ruminococcus flavefaciens]